MYKNILFDVDGTLLPMDVHEFVKYYFGSLCEKMIPVLKIEPKALRLVAASPEKAPWLCLVEGRLGGKTGITVKNNLFIYKSKDVLSDEMTRILGKYREDM